MLVAFAVLHSSLNSMVPQLDSNACGLEAIVMTVSDQSRARSEADHPGTWLNQRERGVIWIIRWTAFWVGVLGRKPARLLVRGIAAYYVLFDRAARDASRDWLSRIHGQPASLGQVYTHILHFAQVTLDRLLFVRGSSDAFEITRTGTKALELQAATGKGAFLLGAHLGSMDAMRAEGQNQKLPVSVVGHFENAPMINAILEALNPELSNQVVHTGRDPVGLALTLRDRIAEG
ncbi:unnamed protein product, partial [marine sediment metagenome]